MAKQPPANEKLVSVTVRMRRDLLEEIRLAAQADNRSVNSYMNATARRALQQLMPDEPRKRGGK